LGESLFSDGFGLRAESPGLREYAPSLVAHWKWRPQIQGLRVAQSDSPTREYCRATNACQAIEGLREIAAGQAYYAGLYEPAKNKSRGREYPPPGTGAVEVQC